MVRQSLTTWYLALITWFNMVSYPITWQVNFRSHDNTCLNQLVVASFTSQLTWLDENQWFVWVFILLNDFFAMRNNDFTQLSIFSMINFWLKKIIVGKNSGGLFCFVSWRKKYLENRPQFVFTTCLWTLKLTPNILNYQISILGIPTFQIWRLQEPGQRPLHLRSFLSRVKVISFLLSLSHICFDRSFFF